ncbi:MAG: transcription antitermination factor NusB [Myxococcota bacterium]|nr:transcription antitermination factor NusB [Myxococcota bacterium]MEE2779968.1 transcription antitermination factor NusB [Myxococcota bacterium]
MLGPRRSSGKSKSRTPTARTLAASTLLAVLEDGAYANAHLGAAMGRDRLKDPRDRALATELVYGVLRWQRRLDRCLTPHLREGGLEPIAWVLLRLGAYQILRLDRIPDPVAVSATQEAARQLGYGRLTGLLNAVLRKVVRFREPPFEGGVAQQLATRTSVPDWLVPLAQEAFGDDAEEELFALRDRAGTSVRPTLKRGGADAVKSALEDDGFEVSDGLHGTLMIQGPGDPFDTEAFRQGLFVPQDPASLAVVDAMNLAQGHRVLDLCAGRGVKSTAILDRGATVLAIDPVSEKLDQAVDLARRLHLEDGLEIRAMDGTSTTDLGTFDRVLIDAPCSGLGTLRRHPEIAWRIRPGDRGSVRDLQQRLLAAGSRHVAPGGLLIYAVCTFAVDEGDPGTPEGFSPHGDPALTRPSEGVDSFWIRAWRRDGQEG